MLLPVFLWLASDGALAPLREIYVVAPWSALIAFLMVSNLATFSWGSLRLRRGVRLWAILLVALVGGALVTAPLETLSVISLLYIGAIPFSVASYARVKRLRGAAARRAPEPGGAEPIL
jgi:CDP-diacylglycerol--serine O-phosphatidyltransferase